jgi:hypothetical protein
MAGRTLYKADWIVFVTARVCEESWFGEESRNADGKLIIF